MRSVYATLGYLSLAIAVLFCLSAMIGCDASTPPDDAPPIAPVAPVAPAIATIGQPAPEIAGTLAAHRGQVVVVSFWATWCAPCRAAIPDERRLYLKHVGNMAMVAVSLDADQRTMDEFARRNSMSGGSWVNVLDAKHDVAKTYAVTSIPTTFIIDRDGVLRGKLTGANHAAVDEMVTKLLAAK